MVRKESRRIYEDYLVPHITFPKIQKSKKWAAVIQEYQWFSSALFDLNKLIINE